MVSKIFQIKFSFWIIFFYAFILLWWIKLQVLGGLGTNEAYIYDWMYGFIGLSGGIFGIVISVKKWGGWKSIIGKALIFLSVGLLGQWFGLQVWTYYNVIAQVEVPYPSLADIGYFSLIPAYTAAALLLAKSSGAKFSLKTCRGLLEAIFIPLAALAIAYSVFLKNIGFDFSDPFKLFFDIGYPLGEIIPVSIAIYIITLSGKLLGGIMRKRILILVAAFIIQFMTEYIFLYMAGAGTYINGGLTDILYPSSHAFMSLGIIAFNNYE